MNYYTVCDQDGFSTDDVDLADVHFTANPTHTSHLGVCGILATPIPYSGGSSEIPEVETDPLAPVSGQMWLKVNGRIGTAGQAMGVLGLTYTEPVADSYDLSIQTEEGKIVRLRME